MPRTHAKPAVRRKPAIDFSITGFIYCTMMMFIGLAAINTQANLLFGVFGLMIGILVVSFLLSGVVLRRMTAERVLPDHMIVGRPSALTYEIVNQKRFWPSLSVTLGEIDGAEAFERPPTAYMLHAANRMSATIAADVIPLRRGLIRLHRYQLSTSFPFGFIKRAAQRRHVDTVLVLPMIGTMRRELMRRFQSAQSVGVNARPRAGGNDEFYGVREYRSGENPRHIYWKRSAGAGPMVVKEMTRVAPPKVVLLVDTHAADGGPVDVGMVEKAIAMAATLVDSCTDAGLPVGLVAWSGEWEVFAADHGKRHRLDLLSTLAKLPPNPQTTTRQLIEKAHAIVRGDTTAVLVTPYNPAVAPTDGLRGSLVVLAADNDTVFTFPEGFAFTPAGPP